MAEDDDIFGHRRRGGFGGDRDSDRRPGTSTESREYARRFDPRSEQEHSNLLEIANRIEASRREMELRRESAEARDAMLAAQQDVHFFPSVGKFIIPERNTWAAHAELVRDNRSNLFFNPEKYVYFDKIIAEKLGNPALTDPTHADYAKYEGLRTNLEVLRNDIIGMYLNDGGFDPGDEKYIPLIAGVATALGEALAGDTWLKRPFVPSLNIDGANVPGKGAQEMYRYLQARQTKPGWLPLLRQAVLSVLHIPDRAWGLPPLEATPFSDENLNAAPPKTNGHKTPEPTVCITPGSPDAGEQTAMLGEQMIVAAQKLRSVDTLEPPAREASVDEARNILRWLRNLQFGDRPLEEWLGQGAPAEQAAKAEALARLVEIYSGQLALMAKLAPARMQHSRVADASAASGALAQGVAEHGISQLLPDHPCAPLFVKLLDSVPPEWEMRQTQAVGRLLEQMESGIEYAAGRTIDRSPAERLLAASNRTHRAARQLNSVDTLEPPTREESIELAREILRKLKNLSFSDKTLDELVDTGRPQDKADTAQKVDEMVDIYKNLLAEAAMANPDILNDKRVKEAGDTAGAFAHALKLMAAKEIPSSVAAAQQISADVTQMPEEWKKLHNRAVSRLVASMEGGLEQAVGAIAAEQQGQEQDEEQAREMIVEASMLHADLSRRKKRRRRKQAGSGLTKSAKRRNANDINGDGVLDKFQGLKLTGEDAIAVRQLGDSLRSLGQQAATLAQPAAEVPPGDKIAPDDKTFGLRERDPRNPNGPRQL